MRHVSTTILLLGHFIMKDCYTFAFVRDLHPSKQSFLLARRGGGHGGTRRRRRHFDKQKQTNTNTVPRMEPPKTRTIKIPLNINKIKHAITLVQVDDDDWWEHRDNINPHGAKPWPAALHIANVLLQHSCRVNHKTIVELGCGTGLVSLVAATLGARVIATDISPMALSLVEEGWKKTRHDCNNMQSGTLTTHKFDITSKEPLSTLLSTSHDDNVKEDEVIVVATAMLYEPNLAQALARRVVEATEMGAWIMIGDDDTGSIARVQFEKELQRLLGTSVRTSELAWQEATVASAELGWRRKNVRILQLNSPI